jgi:hypothetical protein
MVDYAAAATEFRAGRVMSRSFSILFRNILPFGLLALVLTSPTYVYTILTGYGDPMADDLEYSAGTVVLGMVEFLLAYLVTAALVYGTIRDLRNDRASVGECFSKGLSLMFPVIGVVIVSGLVTGLATLALIIPGIIVAIMLWVAIPVAVIEQRGLNSLPRSAELTKGYRWRIFFLGLLLLVVFIGVVFLMGGLMAAIILAGTDSSGEFSTASLTGLIAIEWVFSAFVSALIAVVYAVSYHDLRVAKEGADSQQIASVFD